MGGILRLLFAGALGTWRVNKNPSRGERAGLFVLRYLVIGFVISQLVDLQSITPAFKDVGTLLVDGIKAQGEIARMTGHYPYNNQSGNEGEGAKQ